MKSLLLALLLVCSAVAFAAAQGEKVLYFPVDGTKGINLTYFLSDKIAISGEIAYDKAEITVPAALLDTDGDIVLDANCWRITPGIEYTLMQKDAIRTYLAGRLHWVKGSAEINDVGELEADSLALVLGFGAEYFFNDQLSIAGEYTMKTGKVTTDLSAGGGSIDGPEMKTTSINAATIKVGFHF